MERFQAVQISGIKSTFKGVKMGVLQVSIIGPLLFILSINDIVNLDIERQIMFYAADDTALLFKHKNPEASTQHNHEYSPVKDSLLVGIQLSYFKYIKDVLTNLYYIGTNC